MKDFILKKNEDVKNGSNEKKWPIDLRVNINTGIFTTVFVFLEGVLLWRIVYHKIVGFGDWSLLQKDILYCVLSFLNIAFLFFVLKKWIDIKKLVRYSLQRRVLIVRWVYIAVGLSLFNFLIKFPFGLGGQSPDFVPHHLLLFFVSAILTPIKEEVVFRGILYGALRSRFVRLTAMMFSSIFFILIHESTLDLVWNAQWTFILYHFVTLSIIAFLLAYIYESTHSILICIIFHGIINGVYHIAPIFGFLYGGYIVDGS